MVDLTARLGPSEQTLASLHSQFDAAALTSVADNVETAKQRLSFADQNITNARASWRARPASRCGLVDAIRAAESALGQARTMLDAVDSAATDINRAVAALPSAIADIQNGINQAAGQLRQPNRRTPANSARPATPRRRRSPTPRATAAADPLGAFTQLTKADAELDRLLASVAEEREAAERLSRAFDQALFTAQSRVKAVSDFIDTRRGSIGPEARTRLAEAAPARGGTGQAATNTAEAIAHANGAAMLAGQAQSLANDDVRAAQRSLHLGIRRRRIRHGRRHRRHHHRQYPAGRLFRRIRWRVRRRTSAAASAAAGAWAARRPMAARHARRAAATAEAGSRPTAY